MSARTVIRKAAGSDNVAAQYYLGQMCETGMLAAKDKKDAGGDMLSSVLDMGVDFAQKT